MQLWTVRCREAHVCEDVAFGLIHQLGELLDPRAQLVGDLPPLGPGGFGIVLGEGGADEGRDDAAALLAGVSQHVAHEVDAAALPGRVQDLRDSSLQPLMASETTSLTPRRPRRASLRRK